MECAKENCKKCNSTLLFEFKALNTGIAIAFIEFDFCSRIETCRVYLGKHYFSDLCSKQGLLVLLEPTNFVK